MSEHEDIGRWGNLLTDDDFRLAKKMDNEVEGMDIKVEQGITLRVCPCKIMEVVNDKMLFAQSLTKDLHGRGIAFL